MGQIPHSDTGATEYLLDESKLVDVPQQKKLKQEILKREEKATYCDENIGIDFDIDASPNK